MKEPRFIAILKRQFFLRVLPVGRKYAITVDAIPFQALSFAVIKRTAAFPHQKYGYDNRSLIEGYRKPYSTCLKKLFKAPSQVSYLAKIFRYSEMIISFVIVFNCRQTTGSSCANTKKERKQKGTRKTTLRIFPRAIRFLRWLGFYI